MIHQPTKRIFLSTLLLVASIDALSQTEPLTEPPAPTSADVARAKSRTHLTAQTSDGRHVILKDDQTWEFVERPAGDPALSAVLSVVKVNEMNDACGLDFRLQNNFGARISSLVPRISVFNKAGVLFDSQSLSFASIKPTEVKYTKIQLTGIGCHEISNLKVIDAQHCRMGDIDMFNEKDGECLSHVYVEPSQLINISK